MIKDPDTTLHGNFGFNARYNKSGQPQGQFVYVWRGTYNGVAADFILKSNALSALGFTQTTGGNRYRLPQPCKGSATSDQPRKRRRLPCKRG